MTAVPSVAGSAGFGCFSAHAGSQTRRSKRWSDHAHFSALLQLNRRVRHSDSDSRKGAHVTPARYIFFVAKKTKTGGLGFPSQEQTFVDRRLLDKCMSLNGTAARAAHGRCPGASESRIITRCTRPPSILPSRNKWIWATSTYKTGARVDSTGANKNWRTITFRPVPVLSIVGPLLKTGWSPGALGRLLNFLSEFTA
jgi:hypothetical protein